MKELAQFQALVVVHIHNDELRHKIQADSAAASSRLAHHAQRKAAAVNRRRKLGAQCALPPRWSRVTMTNDVAA